MSLPKHYEKMDYEINGHKLFISKLKLHKAHQSKCHQKVINIHNGKIAKRTGGNKWQVLLMDAGNRYKWFKSDWGDSEYLDTSQYLPLPPPSD
jgi:hypothetical protein